MTQLTSSRSRTQALHSRRGLLPRLQTWAALQDTREHGAHLVLQISVPVDLEDFN